MSRSTNDPMAMARQRMLDASDAKYRTESRYHWEQWQRAAADYWVLVHPEQERFRGADPGRTPTVAEFQELGRQIEGTRALIPSTWRVAPPSPQTAEHMAQVGWLHEALAALYGPVDRAAGQLRSGAQPDSRPRFVFWNPTCTAFGRATPRPL